MDATINTIPVGDIHIGDIVTLKLGQRGRVHELGEADGRFTLFSGKGKFAKRQLDCFYPGDIARIERRKPKRVRLYQIELDSESASALKPGYLFMNYEWARAKGRITPPAEIYEIVFDGQLETDSLRELFLIFNTAHPQGYTNRSMSVSDIIELYDTKGSSFYFCDTYGFKRIRFKPVKYVYALLSCWERDMTKPKFFKSYDKALSAMQHELFSRLTPIEDYKPDEDYGLDATTAWANRKDNYDWRIIRLRVDKSGIRVSDKPYKKLVIWTYLNTSDVRRKPTGCEVEVVEKLALGHGYFGYRVPSPYGGDVICEGYSGAIIGSSLAEVREDMLSGDIGTMRQQVMSACKEKGKVGAITPEGFWDLYHRYGRRKRGT
jgi:hypothetical protein